jgi:DNA-binding CsgD family transcriptional regulator/sugar-specific transcriptional regulator TrmB
VRWGVSADADLVYRTLATFGAREAGTIARELGLSAGRIRQALDELTAIGAAMRRPSVTVPAQLWRAAPPAQVVEQVRQRRMRVQAQVDPVARYVQVLRDAGVAVENAVKPSTRISILGGFAATRQRIAVLSDSTRHEHLSIHPEPVFTTAAMAAAERADHSVLDRGLRIATVCLPPIDGDASAVYSDRLRDAGAQSRFADTLPLKLIIFDRSHAILPLDPLDLSKGALEIADPVSVESLASVFRREWSSGRDPHHGGVPPIVLTQREEELVKLLVLGGTDDVTAKRLQISPRTVTTLVRGLMDRLGVENRFQLGLALGARSADLPGLLPSARAVPPAAGAPALPAQRRKAS